MARQVLEGTWEEIERHRDRLAGHKLRVEVLDAEGDLLAATPANLAELLGDHIGAVEGNGEVLSAETDGQFGEYLAQKQRDGRL